MFLTGCVFFSLAALSIVILNFNPNFSFGFISIFSFLDSAYSTGNYSLDLKKVMQIFSVTSLIILIIADVTKIVFSKLFNVNLGIKPRSKKVATYCAVTLLYFVAIISTFLNQTLDLISILIFLFFYIGNIISLAGYLALNS